MYVETEVNTSPYFHEFIYFYTFIQLFS